MFDLGMRTSDLEQESHSAHALSFGVVALGSRWASREVGCRASVSEHERFVKSLMTKARNGEARQPEHESARMRGDWFPRIGTLPCRMLTLRRRL
jgi:hypothetical protein